LELKENIAYIIYFGVFIISFFVIAIILFVVVYQRKRMVKEKEYELSKKNNELAVLNSIINTQESEREKIARNIHDEIGPLVAAFKLHLAVFEISLGKGTLKKEDLVNERKFTDKILQNIRLATQDLSPKFLLRNGLVESISSYLNELKGVEMTIDTEVNESVKIEDNIGINIYRVVLELTNNIVKHGLPSKIDVDIIISPEIIKFSIVHNGKGISNEDFTRFVEEANGLGLNSLISRTTLLKAELDFQKGKNSKIIFIVPLTYEKND